MGKLTINEKEVKKAFVDLYDAISSTINKESKKDPIYGIIVNNKEYLNNPETMNIMVVQKLFNIIGSGLKGIYKQNVYDIETIYTKWEFFDNNLNELFSHFESPACCADKSRFLLKSYIKFKATNEIQMFDKDSYSTPKKGSEKFWINFVDSLVTLYSGKNIKYLHMLQELVKLYKPKQ